ncbi:unnamed protein product [Clavelina lepadiformis]|uniref:Uncharacterized protein n=2 Tax=Clavelina lepadiformis TaxID=159417 RepID=A0ABP0F158_CLALP
MTAKKKKQAAAKPSKVNTHKGKIPRLTESEIKLQRINELQSLIKDYKKEQKQEFVRQQKITLPLKRINSLPVVYQHVPLVRTIFPESQSVNFGFERPLPDVPNGTIILDEYPDDILEDMKSQSAPSTPTRKLSFLDEGLDEIDMHLLNDVKTTDPDQFLKHRVGSQNMEEILKNLNPFKDKDYVQPYSTYKAFRRRLLLCLIVPLLIAATAVVVVGVTTQVTTPPAADPDPDPVSPPVDPNKGPVHYVPPAKSLLGTTFLLNGPMYCDPYLPGYRIPDVLPPSGSVAYDRIHVLFTVAIRKVMISMGFKLGNSYALSMVRGEDELKLHMVLFAAPFESVPLFEWLGMKFDVSLEICKKQIYIFLQHVLFPELAKWQRLVCRVKEDDLKGDYSAMLLMGQLFSTHYYTPATPNIPSSYKGIIGEKLKELSP